MGVDCKIYLSSRVRIGDAARAIGILLGCEKRKAPLGGDGWHVVVEGVKTRPSSMAECAEIHVETKNGPRFFLWHWEFGTAGQRGIMPRSTGTNIALCKALADCFGGVVDYNDCDSADGDYYVEERFDCVGEDDAAFYRMQERLMSLEPLSELVVQQHVKTSAYGVA